MDKDWPTYYPDNMKDISWCIDGKCAGPFRYYNKYIPYCEKGNSKFIKQMLLDYFYKNGCGIEVCDGWCQWVADRVTVYMMYDEAEFKVKLRTKKDSKEPMLKKDEFIKMSKRELGLDAEASMAMLKFCMKYLQEAYTNMA